MAKFKDGVIEMGLCKGRHDIPGVENYVFDHIEDPSDIEDVVRQCEDSLLPLEFDKLVLYVTGLTVALV